MALTARKAKDYIRHALGGDAAPEVGGFDMVNQAGISMEGSRDWAYLTRSTQALPFRAPPTGGTTGVWTLASTQLEDAGTDPYSGYTYVPGDFVTMTVAGSKVAVAPVTGYVDDDTITVDWDGADIAGGITHAVDVSRVALPSDFGRVVKVYGTVGFTRTAIPSTSAELMRIDTHALGTSNFRTGYAVEWNQATTKSQPVATLRVWPEPSTAEVDALSAVYLRKWPEVTNDDDIISIPEFMEGLFLQYCRVWALGFEGKDSQVGVDINQGLAVLEAGPIYTNARRQDSRTQQSAGVPPMRAVRTRGRGPGFDPLSGVRSDRLFTD